MSKRRNIDNLHAMCGVIDLVAGATEGLDFAGKQNFVQRNIKPENIMYEPDSDTVNIAGFGIAFIKESSKTKTGMVPGTPSCRSPEQLAGKKFVGHMGQFSLGVMCYQMLSGSLPFKAGAMASLMFEACNLKAADIRTARADIPGTLATVINKVSMKNAKQRFPAGPDFANALIVYLKPWS